MRDEDVSVEEAIARIDEAQERVAAAARALSEDEFAGSGQVVLREHAELVQRVAQQVLYVALSGELPPDGGAPEPPHGREAMLSSVREALDSLYVHVREADPEGFLDCTWRHPQMGEMDWRGWLLSLADDGDRCADALGGLNRG